MNFFFEQSIVNNITILPNLSILLCQIFILNFFKNNISKELILFHLFLYYSNLFLLLFFILHK